MTQIFKQKASLFGRQISYRPIVVLRFEKKKDSIISYLLFLFLFIMNNVVGSRRGYTCFILQIAYS